MRPDDITHFTFLKKLQIILPDIPDAFNNFIKDLSIGDKGAHNFGFNSNIFDNYFFRTIAAHIIIYCKKISQD